ncbi:DNA replication ATP-dependent helicase/nuclease DNA2-like [Dreissena polymorpha]|uniref:DNA replication ATP-dependent helicase/nuclease DNA2-like n=1 Tax=Dreissena polymorpha TaxID=45954 RepID=UPI002264A870|nr:DNA replication ATP-dependent helicase/nuclease DNA2-like [Dreissena polymorpha]
MEYRWELGMDESLFLHLDRQQATFELHLQYRMNREMMKLSNSLVYEGRLQCGSEAVATQALTIPHPHMACQVIAGSAWMRQVLDVQLTSSVVFLNTEKLSASHSKVQGGGFRNETEANIVNHVIKGFAHVGISGSEIGVIAP